MLNRIDLIGNVGVDPEIKTIAGGQKVAQFSLATTEKWKNKDGEQQSETEWHRIVIWGNLAEVVEKYVKKGDKLHITGKIKTRMWEKDGQKRYSTDIIGRGMIMLGGSTSTPGGGTAEPSDDLPF